MLSFWCLPSLLYTCRIFTMADVQLLFYAYEVGISLPWLGFCWCLLPLLRRGVHDHAKHPGRDTCPPLGLPRGPSPGLPGVPRGQGTGLFLTPRGHHSTGPRKQQGQGKGQGKPCTQQGRPWGASSEWGEPRTEHSAGVDISGAGEGHQPVWAAGVQAVVESALPWPGTPPSPPPTFSPSRNTTHTAGRGCQGRQGQDMPLQGGS